MTNNIGGSATKLVFLTITVTLCVAFLFEVCVGRITLEAKDFIGLALMAFTFYFANKGDNTQPFAGK